MNPNLAIVPAHNEVEAITSTIAAIRQSAPDFDVLVVDDGSTDATAKRASAAGAGVLRLCSNSPHAAGATADDPEDRRGVRAATA